MVATLSWFVKNLRIVLSAAVAALFVALFSVCSASVGAGNTTELDLDPAHAPYKTKIVKSLRFSHDEPGQTSYMMADIEGDGNLELVTAEKGHLLGWDCEDGYIKPRFQINLAPGWNFHYHSSAWLGVTSDRNGDHTAELYLTLVTDDRSAWRFQAIDLATQDVVVDVSLPLGVDRRADGVWDGSYMPVGFLDDADGQGTSGVVLLRNADYDANPRGIVVVNARSGEMIWEWTCGPNPDVHSQVVADLDGDGVPEIVLFGNSPDNLGGQLVNGTSDDRSCLFVLSATGQELWRQELGGVFNAGAVLVADLDSDGKPEIITYTRNGTTGQSNRLIVWDYATHSRIVTQRQEAMLSGVAVLAGPRPNTSWLVTGSNDGFITRNLFADGQLTREVRRMTDYRKCRVVGAVDILPEAGAEVLVDLGSGQVFAVLNADLESLAVLRDDHVCERAQPLLWQRTADKLDLVVGDIKAHYVLEFERRPRQVSALVKVITGGLLFLALLAGAYLLGRRSRRHQAVFPHEPILARIADREVLYRVWRQLDDVKHEKFLEANRGLRRLVWLLEAYATDLGASDTLGVRIGQLLADFNDSVQPRLLEILRLADSEKFEVEAVAKATNALESLGSHLGNLDVETLTLESVRAHGEKMNEALGEVETGFLHLWSSLRRYFSTDVVRMLQGMLLVREVELECAGVETRLDGVATVGDSVCLIDSSCVRFILDNLIDNAVRAMSDSARRLLVITVERTDTELVLRVSDTGRGIDPDRRDAVFNGRTSDQAGGGAGLFRTREILQRWRGEIQLDDSSTGQGTTFIVKLRAATKMTADTEDVRALRGEA